ncbi:anti-CBASS protein Acb1 family protein [Desulfovibrio sp. SGI.169]|uniref:anti-CBASS protein Acb1 family protein n=1 Tax=Desulfovibrio sp. SGI.169 TaxID=3420561 RepID=UPI003CFE2EAE
MPPLLSIRNYYDHIRSQQEKVLRAGVQKALDCIQLHEFREIDRAVSFDFAPLGEEDRAALATQQKTRADTIAVYLDRGVISAEEARAAIANDPDSGFADIDPDDLPESAGMGGEMPPGMEGGSELDDVDKAGAVYDAALDARRWCRTEKGKHFELDTESGEITKGNIGQNEWDSPSAQGARRDKVEDAMREIANGKAEATVSSLRNDLEQYGGTNDVTIIRGDEKKGLLHIEKRHGSGCIAPVLEAVANGKIVRFVKGNKTVHLDKDGYRAVLSLEEHGKKKTWLLTGYDIVGGEQKNVTGDSGKVSARHASTHVGPILSRPDMGAVSSFIQKIDQILAKSNVREGAHG